jgi:hypothetical protein
MLVAFTITSFRILTSEGAGEKGGNILLIIYILKFVLSKIGVSI